MHIICSTLFHIVASFILVTLGALFGIFITIGFTYGKAEDMARQYVNKLIWKIKKGEIDPKDINYILE